MSRRDGRTPRQRVFGVFYRGDERAREVSPSRSALSSPLSARDSVRFGRDVAPRRPHTMSVYRRPRNDEQLPRWFQHRTSYNWTAPSYVYSPGISAKCHFAIDSPFHWKPPPESPRRLSTSSSSRSSAKTPRGFDVPLSSPFASAPSSPRLRTAWLASRQSSDDVGETGRDYLYIQTPPSTAGSGAMDWRRPG